MHIHYQKQIDVAVKNGIDPVKAAGKITVRLRPSWLAWILNRFYPRGCVTIWIDNGWVDDDDVFHGQVHYGVWGADPEHAERCLKNLK